jgi:hypothetical protein
MLNRKGMSQMWWLLAMGALAILVLVLLVMFFRDTGERGFDSINDKIGGLSDSDKDLIPDLQDQCPCDYGTKDNDNFKGCPSSVTTSAQKNDLNAKSKDTEGNCR